MPKSYPKLTLLIFALHTYQASSSINHIHRIYYYLTHTRHMVDLIGSNIDSQPNK